VESQVTREVEEAVSSIAGVKHVLSTVQLGTSISRIEFHADQDKQRATEEVRTAIDSVRKDIPQSVEEPIIDLVELETEPVVTYAVSAESLTDVALSDFIDEVVSRKLMGAEGIADVRRLGGVDNEINVTLDPDRLQALGLTAPDINNALRQFNLDAPGGKTEIAGREQTVRVLSAAVSVARLSEMTIPTGDGRSVRLADVASVASGARERSGFATFNGSPVVAFQVMKTQEASNVTVEDMVQTLVGQLRDAHPKVTFTKIYSTARNTRQSFGATMRTLIEGMLLAAIVVWLFLRDFRSTVIAALAMPLSLIPTFAIMYVLGFSINLLTLLALTLVIGILVDDAIVEIENIQKRIERGESPYDAAYAGADAIGLAVIATTLSIAVVFMPVSFLSSTIGKFFREFGLTVAASVMFSLIVARLLTPLLAAYFLKPSKSPGPRKPFAGPYRRVLEWALVNRWKAIGIGLATFFATLFLSTFLGTGFTPSYNDGIVNIEIEGPPGATLDDMRTANQRLVNRMMQEDDVGIVFSSIGAGGDIRKGIITLVLDDERERTNVEFERDMRPALLEIPDVRLGFVQLTLGGQNTIEFMLTSEDPVELDRTARLLEEQMRERPEFANVHLVTPRPSPELVVSLKPEEAARLGVTAQSVAAVARVATLGELDSNSSKFNQGENRLNIRVRLAGEARSDLDAVGNLRVPTAQGAMVPLSAVADLRFKPGVAYIERFNRQRQMTVKAERNDIAFGDAVQIFENLPVMRNLPPGVRQPDYGQTEIMNDLLIGFGFAMVAGTGMVVAVLMLLFKSIFKPVTILAALPLSFSGAFIGLLLGGGELNLPAFMGILMLMGLAAKNSILLVELAIELEREGASRYDALIEACRERARPIIMTTCAMIAGMLPAALAIGEGSEFRVPMALAVIGGLVSSTALSLILVPAFYEIIDDLELRVRSRLSKYVTKVEQQAPENRPDELAGPMSAS
jgi:HAE1 family hydrophobic/amphiphilic exporter-1